MMLVIDASVYVSRLQRQEAQHVVSARLFEVAAACGMPVLCPEILLPEVTAALARGLDDTELACRAAAHLRRLPGHRFIAVDGALSGLAARLAAEYRLRGCDAIYAALALREGAILITWDKQQRERIASVVETLTPTAALAVLR
ncbi:MAG: type II toxin-antitoxin system VapC family toxin [Anaerolineae bacterium]|nr:type II toxin-antitoxin system VapC family toxin [Anaerolineae bacterium]